jgi:trafficking protein particle complex subunit 10
MSSHRATITYTAPQTFLSTDHWKQVYASLLSQLPLRNLHWKPSTRPTIRTIQELHVDFIAADAKRDEHTYQVPQTLLEKPLLNAYIVICEVRPTIGSFVANAQYMCRTRRPTKTLSRSRSRTGIHRSRRERTRSG